MGIVHGEANYLPDFLDYFSTKFPSAPVKMEILGKKDIETTTMANFYSQVSQMQTHTKGRIDSIDVVLYVCCGLDISGTDSYSSAAMVNHFSVFHSFCRFLCTFGAVSSESTHFCFRLRVMLLMVHESGRDEKLQLCSLVLGSS